MIEVVLVIGLGGAIGAILRWGVNVFFNYISAPAFGSTLAVNLIGSFLIGFLLVWFQENELAGTLLKTGIVVGLLGGFTTYSTFSMEVLQMMMAGSFASDYICRCDGAGVPNRNRSRNYTRSFDRTRLRKIRSC
jgi:CrcB protein